MIYIINIILWYHMISYDIINNLASKVSFVSFVINIYEGNTKVVYIRRWRYETVFLTKVFFNVNILRMVVCLLRNIGVIVSIF